MFIISVRICNAMSFPGISLIPKGNERNSRLCGSGSRTRPAFVGVVPPRSGPLVSPFGSVLLPHPRYRSAAQPFESSREDEEISEFRAFRIAGDGNLFLCSSFAPWRTRTSDLRVRSPVLYPAELRTHGGWMTGFEPATTRTTIWCSTN